MIPVWQLVIISALYIATLFGIAWYGDRRAQCGRPIHNTGFIYSLALAVYCTSWTFYGAVGQAASNGWVFLSIYLGPIIFITVFWRLLAKIVRIAKEKRITSIADFIATRYGRDHTLAVLVTLVAILCVVPYIALQLKAISTTFELLTLPLGREPDGVQTFWEDTAFYISLAMASFVIIFGTRDIDASEQHPGMMLAIAFESLLKLVAFVAVGLWVFSYLYDSPADLLELTEEVLPDHPLMHSDLISLSFMLQTLLAGFAMLALPRQFQVSVIENESIRHIKTARWLFPLYLLLMMIFVVPVALTGHLFMQDIGFSPDTYVLSLPVALGHESLAIMAFIGGGSAATAMIIVATIAISTMVSNEMVLPALFRQRGHEDLQRSSQVRNLILTVRRLVILVMMLGSYLFYRLVGQFDSLAAIGMLSFAAAAQFAPPLIGGLFWQGGNRQGAIAGLLAGTSVWFYGLMWPFITQTIPGMEGRHLTEMAIGMDIDDFSVGVLMSLAANVFFYFLFSIVTNASVRERMLAGDFTSARSLSQPDDLAPAFDCKVDDVRVVLERILGFSKSEDFFNDYQSRHGIQYNNAHATASLLQEAEKLLASIMGSSSARVIFSTLLGGERIQIRDLAFLASEASQAFAMSRDQLQAAVEHLQQGVSVVDRDLNLVAWNSRYLEIFNYPAGFIHTGKPIQEVIAFNAGRGFCGSGEIEEQVSRRMDFLRHGSAHAFERSLPNGQVIYMQGHPMPDGGFVTSFTDITVHRQAEQALREANTSLERRVEKSTAKLDDLTARLIEANHSKTRFLAATSHDLMQPLNAAKLFASTLAQKQLNDEQQQLLDHLEGALQSSEDVLSVLVEIAKLDAGAMEPGVHPIELASVLKPLTDEFTALAADKGLSLTVRPAQGLWVSSDSHWLRRIIQNLISNAVRYTEHGKVLVGCRKRGDNVMIQVWDTGIGIPEHKLVDIFGEFKRLNEGKQDTKGLGLGLAIVERMAKRMGHEIKVQSKPGKGTCFSITVPLAEPQVSVATTATPTPMASSSFTGMPTFCIDNDPEVLAGMEALLNTWECDLYATDSLQGARDIPFKPAIMLADYQLDNDETGLQAMNWLREHFNDPQLPGILISADPRDSVANEARELGYYFLKKPIRPAALRAVIRKMVSQ